MGEDEGSVPLIRFTNLFCSNTEVQVDVMLSGGECIFNIRPPIFAFRDVSAALPKLSVTGGGG